VERGIRARLRDGFEVVFRLIGVYGIPGPQLPGTGGTVIFGEGGLPWIGASSHWLAPEVEYDQLDYPIRLKDATPVALIVDQPQDNPVIRLDSNGMIQALRPGKALGNVCWPRRYGRGRRADEAAGPLMSAQVRAKHEELNRR